jgi:hypothetical protein
MQGKRNRRQVNYRKSDSEDEEVSAGGDDDEFNGNLSDDSDDSSDDPDAFPSDSVGSHTPHYTPCDVYTSDPMHLNLGLLV